MESKWGPNGVHMESKLSPNGIHEILEILGNAWYSLLKSPEIPEIRFQDSTWGPSGIQVGSRWSPNGVQIKSKWSPNVVQVEFLKSLKSLEMLGNPF